ncbi:MAG: response regulator [Nitrospirae bacterium]|nr:response regulator [Nitrospirota bacterium]
MLLVDDEPLIRESLGLDLGNQGHEVNLSENGESALAELRTRRYDLVLTDLVMEGVDGLQLLRDAKEIDPEVVVMVMTAYGSLPTAIQAMRLGAADYLLKPCHREEMFLRVAKCLENLSLRKKIRLYERILPVCAYCRRIRDDVGREPGTGEWMPAELFIARKTNIDLSHGICPDCRSRISATGP